MNGREARENGLRLDTQVVRMTEIVAGRLVEHLERAGCAIMNRPSIGVAAATGGYELRQ